MLRSCSIYRSVGDWSVELDLAIKLFKGGSFKSVLNRLTRVATIYHMWRERSARVHGGHVYTEEQIIRAIKKDIRLILSSNIRKTIISKSTRELQDKSKEAAAQEYSKERQTDLIETIECSLS